MERENDLVIEILQLTLRLVDDDGEVGPTVDFLDGARVAAALVDDARAPVEADDLVADRVDVVGRVEGGQLVRQDLPHREERQRSHSQEVVLFRVTVHHCCHLLSVQTNPTYFTSPNNDTINLWTSLRHPYGILTASLSHF